MRKRGQVGGAQILKCLEFYRRKYKLAEGTFKEGGPGMSRSARQLGLYNLEYVIQNCAPYSRACSYDLWLLAGVRIE
jgi:hypothetical protein